MLAHRERKTVDSPLVGYLFYPLILLGCHEFLGELLQKRIFKIILEWSFNGGNSTSFVSPMTRLWATNFQPTSANALQLTTTWIKLHGAKFSHIHFQGSCSAPYTFKLVKKKPMNEWPAPTAERLVILWEMSKHWGKTSTLVHFPIQRNVHHQIAILTYKLMSHIVCPIQLCSHFQ